MHTRKTSPTAPLALLLILAAALGACTPKTAHPPLAVTFLPGPGDFVSVSGEPLSLDDVLKLARDKDYILIGEDHRNVCDHSVQQRVLAALAGSDTPPVVGLEMVAADKQPVLDDFAAGMVSVDDLEAELEWSERWGSPFSLFRGHFEIIRRHSLPVAGLNVPSAVTRKIARQGIDALDPDERAWLPAEIVPVPNAQVPYLDAVLDQHAGRDTRSMEADAATRRERFFLVQSIWDSAMAEQAVALRRKYDWPVLVVAGGGHVEHGWGIARRISRFDPGARILLLMPWRGGEFEPDAANAFFFCPETYQSRMGMTLTATGRGGLLVERVARGSRADAAGLRPGDLLTSASGVRLDQLMDLHMAGFKVHEADAPLVFTVVRADRSFTIDVGRLGSRSGDKPAPGNDDSAPASHDPATPANQSATVRGR
jgi:uncharacterized iron-regulated protein